jgi:hypothetical protein
VTAPQDGSRRKVLAGLSAVVDGAKARVAAALDALLATG